VKLNWFIAALVCPIIGWPVSAVADNADAVRGTINFANGAAQVNAPIVFAETGWGISGPDWRVELLLQTSSNLVSIAGPIGLESGSLAGYFFAGSIPVPGMTSGESAMFKIRVQNVATQFSAESDPVDVTLGGGTVPPANLIGLKGLQIPGPVSLSITKSGTNLILSWPISAFDMKLQVSDEFPPTWRSAASVKSTNESSVWMTVDLRTSSQFFRLISN
jgi:hypothetical protein